MSEDSNNKSNIIILGALLTATASIIAGLLQSSFAERVAEKVIPNTPEVVTATAIPPTQAPTETVNRSLLINGVEYSLPNPESEPFCVAQDAHTDGFNKITYDLVVPEDSIII